MLPRTMIPRRLVVRLLHPTSIVKRSTCTDFGNPNPLSNHKDWLHPNDALKIFTDLQDPDSVTTVLSQYSKRRDYKPNEALYTLIVNKLGNAKKFDEIEDVMRRIKVERKCRLSNDFFFTVIKVYGNLAGRINRAVQTLFEMPSFNCRPTVKTFNFVLNLLVWTKQYEVVHEVYLGASRLDVQIDACTLNILIKGLCGCGKLDSAHQVLDEFPQQNCVPNVRTFSTLMHGLCERGRLGEAFGLLERMEREGIDPDTVTFNILISGLRKQGKVEEGAELLDRMRRKGCEPNSGSYQEVLYGLFDAKMYVQANDFMRRMIAVGGSPSFDSYRSIIYGLCECEGDLMDDVDWALKQMVRHGFAPKMGMWKKILRSMHLEASGRNCISFKEIAGN